MKILFTHGYFLAEDPKEQVIMKPYPPLGILYISSYLAERGIDHDVFDTTFSNREYLYNHLISMKPDLVAFYVNLMTKANVLQLIRFIHNCPDLNHTRIVLGGPDIRYNYEKYLMHGADYVVVGEGEETMFELIMTLKKGESPKEVKGIAYKDESNNPIINPPRPHIKDVDALKMPNREAIDIESYLETWKKYHGTSTISVNTQRGCPYTCRWCSTAVYGQSYRRRSPEKVAEEMEYLKNRYNPDMIWFVDDVFTVSHKWVAGLRESLSKKGLKIPFECISRADRLNYEVLEMLAEMGCTRIWIGAESGSQRILDAMDRRVKVEKVQNCIQMAKSLGIETGTFIMIGYPGETQEDIEDTIQHLRLSNPDLFTITLTYPIAGTSLYDEVLPDIINLPEWRSSSDREIDFKRTYSAKYYHYAIRWIVNEINFYKSVQNGKLLSPSTFIYKSKSIFAKAGMKLARMK